jgi:hypothetical protein
MKFMNDLWAARLSLTLIAAIDLDVFTPISKSCNALKAGGMLVIAEMVPNDSRTVPFSRCCSV